MASAPTPSPPPPSRGSLPGWVAPLLFTLGVAAAIALAMPASAPASLPAPARAPLPAAPVDEGFGVLLPRGATAPDFEVRRLEGGSLRLSSLRGKVVLLDFWATWCPPCREEMPWLVKLGAEYQGRGLALVAVSQDAPPDQDALVRRFAAVVPGLERFAVLGDDDLGRLYGAEDLPTLYVLDRAGRVLDVAVGSRPEQVVRTAVERALAAP